MGTSVYALLNIEITLSGSTVGTGAGVAGLGKDPMPLIVNEPAASMSSNLAVMTACPLSTTETTPKSLTVATEAFDVPNAK